ncbi:glycogen debranching N-terminal domain-containing protein [Nesterenkonia sp. PF2B19]|uniref:glycogen debranching N-terminal domain-containing protein n=1 Tax=unclassified Nesterenkonia TaxID=2629769 RepID=UPI000A19B90F|nr:glycogen debranching N-terminal domain-containing protein [Nesterenkonia sp. PF2B19]OSM43862.1 amylo-alpha-1,6-glucosidase [Nesterenkonia sp. PF2B19]
MTETPNAPLQPLLSDALVAFRAPTQVWSGADGDIGGSAVEGIFHGDVRHVRRMSLLCPDSQVETISRSVEGPDELTFQALLREVDDPTPDPKVRLRRDRQVSPGVMTETWRLSSAVSEEVTVRLGAMLVPEFASMHDVKAGVAADEALSIEQQDGGIVVTSGARRLRLEADGAALFVVDGSVHCSWTVTLAPRGRWESTLRISMEDPGLVVRAPSDDLPTAVAEQPLPADPRAGRWLHRAVADLDALRLALPESPQDGFYAAGAPWFFTLFGRDSLWASRLALPVVPGSAAPTLRTLARLQSTDDDAEAAREPGKILHELRSGTLSIPGEAIELPPLYYGSVDSTPLWICLLAEAREHLTLEELRGLRPALRAALRWILVHGDGDGFLDYIDRTGHGLANQGWKDSGDSIQWRDGRLAEGPIALCEVQGYAYEAVLVGAEILEVLGEEAPNGSDVREGDDDVDLSLESLRRWAAELRERFHRHFWVETEEGRYPAIALDRHKRPVDTLTSNIGHLIGTGILDPEQEAQIAELLLGESMSSGYGVRTMSTEAAGYWPLSYHGGSVWMHDTAIIVHGMLRAGLTGPAARIAEQMLDAAEGFAYRVPELQSGDPVADVGAPVPYPAACRPQAWSAAAAVVCAQALAGAEEA